MTFNVIDLKTGKSPDPENVALNEEWAKELIYCDVQGFLIDEDGELCLADECGNFVYCPHDRFKVIVKFPESRFYEFIY